MFIRGLFAVDLAREGATRRASPSILRKCGGPWCVAEACGLILCRKFEQFFEGTRRIVDACVRIAEFCEPLRHREYGKVGWLAVANLVPVKWRGHSGVGERAHRIRRACRPILRVLVVIEEYAVALLFPPFRGGQGGRAPLDGTR